jgi:hypothetical protein
VKPPGRCSVFSSSGAAGRNRTHHPFVRSQCAHRSEMGGWHQAPERHGAQAAGRGRETQPPSACLRYGIGSLLNDLGRFRIEPSAPPPASAPNFRQLTIPQGVQTEVRFGCAGQYLLNDVAHECEPTRGFVQVRRVGLNELRAPTNICYQRLDLRSHFVRECMGFCRRREPLASVANDAAGVQSGALPARTGFPSTCLAGGRREQPARILQ